MGTRSRLRWLVGWGAVAAVVMAGTVARACMDYGGFPEGPTLAVMSDDPAEAKAAIETLRKQGPRGLQMLLRAYNRELMQQRANPGVSKIPPRLAAAIDAVAAQKDAAYSGLYWHTDFEQAKAAARASGKPILSLRLLGRLDNEFSCANSRYFRTVLYADSQVSHQLRSRFVLHWQSVRPVPKVTIDMGDGRVIERTVTGNSVHYVLDAEGRPVDAIPGLYGAKAFLRAVTGAADAALAQMKAKDANERSALAALWHRERLIAVGAELAADVAQVRGVPPAAKAADANGLRKVTASEAASVAVTKSGVELRVVDAVLGVEPQPPVDDDTWRKIAALPRHAEEARLDDGSRAMVRAKHPAARDAGARAETKRIQEDPLVRVIANLERSVAQDTVRNEYDLHQRIHRWFAGNLPETQAADVAALNEKVYAELFLTPSSDPWLGLVPEDAYSALEGNGVRAAAN